MQIVGHDQDDNTNGTPHKKYDNRFRNIMTWNIHEKLWVKYFEWHGFQIYCEK